MVGLNHQQCKTIFTERFRLSPSSEFTGKKIKNSTFLQVNQENTKNNHENASQITIQIHIKRPKKLKMVV